MQKPNFPRKKDGFVVKQLNISQEKDDFGPKTHFSPQKNKKHFLKLYGQTPKRLFLLVFSRTKFVFIAKIKYSLDKMVLDRKNS